MHAAGDAKACLHHRTADSADLFHIVWASAAIRFRQDLQPLPAIRAPQFFTVVAAVIDKLNVLRPAHRLGVNFKFRHWHTVLWPFIVKGKTACIAA